MLLGSQCCRPFSQVFPTTALWRGSKAQKTELLGFYDVMITWQCSRNQSLGYYWVLMPGVITMSEFRNTGQLTTPVLSQRTRINERKDKTRVHNMSLQKTRILDLILLPTFSLTQRKLQPSWLWAMGYLVCRKHLQNNLSFINSFIYLVSYF